MRATRAQSGVPVFAPARAPIQKQLPAPKAVDTFTPPAPKALPAERRPILLFNDQCAVCRTISAWVKREDDGGKDLIDERPIGNDPEALLALNPNLDIWEVYTDIHMVMPDGSIRRGGDAVGEVLKRLPSQRWYAWTFDIDVGGVKPFQKLLNGAYHVLNEVRPAIGCESCGGGPVVWWAKPVQWTANAVRWIKSKLD